MKIANKGVISTIVDDIVDGISDNVGAALTDEEKAKLAPSIQIVDDNRMPYTDDCPVDIILNMSGAIRR